jgi:rhodanese-related sulfurtransferase
MSSLLQWAFQTAMPSLGDRAIGFDDLLGCIRNPAKYAIIHTMPESETVLINGTLTASQEESFINEYLSKYVETQKTIILYGRNCCDDSTRKKRAQLLSLGISNVYIYVGGLFEWILLQDIYGTAEFPTTNLVTDLLAYRPRPIL